MLLLVAAGYYVATSRSADHSTVEASRAFDGHRAYETLKKVVALGPRPVGSPQAEALRRLIRAEIGQAGLDLKEIPFTAETPLGKRSMVNLVAEVKGDRDGVIALTNHYDTKLFDQFQFVGANDGGSSTAWMIEMARVLGPRRQGRSVWLVWFDGEEAFKEWSSTDGIYGSREMVRHLRADNGLTQIKTLINIDMVGDCYLGIMRDPGAPSWLSNAVWKAAAELGHERAFLPDGRVIEDDHMPFRLAGVPCLNLIDFEYGGSPSEHEGTWHTARDTIERVCPASLQAVGDVIYHALPAIDAFLDAQARLD